MTLKSIASLCVLLRKPSSVPHKLWHAFIGHSLGRLLCLAPEEFEKSGSGPWPKKVVHHCSTGTECLTNKEWQNYLPFLVNITGHYLQQLKFDVGRETTNCSQTNLCSNVASFKVELVNLQVRQTTLLLLQTSSTCPKKRLINS